MSHNRQYTDDEDLVLKIQAGDRAAFSGLYRAWFFDLCDFVYRYIRRPDVCEELVQDLFLSIWRNRREWNPGGTVRAYMYKAAKNRAIDYIKHLRVEREYLGYRKIEREWETLTSRYGPGYLSEADEELAEAIEEAVEQLPDRRREIFKLSRDDGLTYREIAEVLDISVKTVETQMGRSLKSLRERLSDWLPGLALLWANLQNWL